LNRSISIIMIIIFVLILGGAAFFLLRENPDSAQPVVTEEAAASEEELAATEEALATEEESESTAVFVPAADGYSITPAQAEFYTDSGPGGLDAPEAGQQLVLLTVSLLNEATDEPTPVSADDLTLFDEDDNAYEPLEDGGTVSPYLIGSELTRDESLRGFVIFQIPTDATPAIIQWCPNGACDSAVRADILLLEDE